MDLIYLISEWKRLSWIGAMVAVLSLILGCAMGIARDTRFFVFCLVLAAVVIILTPFGHRPFQLAFARRLFPHVGRLLSVLLTFTLAVLLAIACFGVLFSTYGLLYSVV